MQATIAVKFLFKTLMEQYFRNLPLQVTLVSSSDVYYESVAIDAQYLVSNTVCTTRVHDCSMCIEQYYNVITCMIFSCYIHNFIYRTCTAQMQYSNQQK